MKAFLLHWDADFDAQAKLPPEASLLTQDLDLETLFQAMAGGDEFLLDVARKVVFSAVKNDIDTILYRQDILKDCLKNSRVVSQLYDLAVEAIAREKKDHWLYSSERPSLILSGSVRSLNIFTDVLRRLRSVAQEHAGQFESRGFTALFAMLRRELSDEYLAAVQAHLAELKLKRGVLLSAQLGKGGATGKHMLRKPHGDPGGWLARLLRKPPPGYTFRLHPRDETGGRILSGMCDRGVNLAANALGQSRDHVLSFFITLRTELAFYIGCVNLHARLAALGEPVCFATPMPPGQRRHAFSDLYDVCLALTMGRKVVGNSARIEGKGLAIVTGANQGGKSTFLRSIGLAQLMMQAGMFVAAQSFAAGLCTGLFTHYKREEDPTMRKGKLDEELSRMSEIAGLVRADSLVLFNESFAATNEREGSEIAYQVVSALLEKRVRTFFVTHQYEFARRVSGSEEMPAFFLRAERKPDGTRTYRVVEGKPLPTSFGEDLYREIFGSVGNSLPDQDRIVATRSAAS